MSPVKGYYPKRRVPSQKQGTAHLSTFQNQHGQGLYLRNARQALNISQVELAKALGKSRSYVVHVERGERIVSSEETARRYAEVLGVDYDTIFLSIHRIPPDLLDWLHANPGVVKSLRTVQRRMQGTN